MLTVDAEKRLSAESALKHQFLAADGWTHSSATHAGDWSLDATDSAKKPKPAAVECQTTALKSYYDAERSVSSAMATEWRPALADAMADGSGCAECGAKKPLGHCLYCASDCKLLDTDLIAARHWLNLFSQFAAASIETRDKVIGQLAIRHSIHLAIESMPIYAESLNRIAEMENDDDEKCDLSELDKSDITRYASSEMAEDIESVIKEEDELDMLSKASFESRLKEAKEAEKVMNDIEQVCECNAHAAAIASIAIIGCLI